MSVFNLSVFNFGNIFSGVLPKIVPTSYQGITLYGKGGFGRLYGVNYVYTEAEQNELDGNQPFPDREWTIKTFILANFQNSLQAGNITSLPEPLDGWILSRKAKEDVKFTTLGLLGALDTQFIDRLAASNEDYTYRLIPKTGSLLGAPLDSDETSTDFTQVVLLDPDTEQGFSFCLDLRMSEINIEEDLSVKDTRGKYQTILKGNKRVNTGTIGFLATSSAVDDNELQQDIAYLKEFEDFILDSSKAKILKLPKGYIFKVFTSDFSKTKRTSVNNQGQTLYTISFSFREVGEVI